MSSDTKCIQCGQPAGDPLRLNHMPNGKACTACRDRLLDSLPAPFPAAVAHENPAGKLFSMQGADSEPESTQVSATEDSSQLRALPPVDPGSVPYEDDGGYTPSA